MSDPAALHSHEQFSFLVEAPPALAFPLFGALRERDWAPGWAPRFLWPQPPADCEGMVFEIDHPAGLAHWVNTVFDRDAGRVGYVYVIPGVMTTRIAIALRPHGAATQVSVTYQRTALAPAAGELVRSLALEDRLAGAEWDEQIRRHLRAAQNA